MKKLIFLLSIVIAAVIGLAISMATGIDPTLAVGGSVISSFIIMPVISNALPQGITNGAVVLKTAYEAELLRGLKTIKNDFLARIPDRSDLVGNDVIDLTKAGVKPNVLIDNTVYPIAAAQRVDSGSKLSLRKLTTEVTIITEDELYALPYDKKSSVIVDHKEALQEYYRMLALYSFCPTTSTATTPVLATTGDDDGTGRLRLTKTDLIKFRSALNDVGVGVCDLVLCKEHVEDILLWSEVFEKQYQVIASGLVLPMYGFNMTQDQGYAPVFNAGSKQAFGAATIAGDSAASIAYLPKRMLKAYGSLKMFFDEPTARMHQSEVNFDAHFIAVPKDTEGTGAIISGAA